MAAILAACANPRAESAAMAPQLLVGMPKQALLSCAGVPERSAAVDNLEFYTYSSQRTVAHPTPALGLWGSHYTRGFGYGWGAPIPFNAYEVQSQSCEATFTLRNGVVEKLVFGGDSAGAGRLGQCYAIVENCLAMVPRVSAPPPAPALRTPSGTAG